MCERPPPPPPQRPSGTIRGARPRGGSEDALLVDKVDSLWGRSANHHHRFALRVSSESIAGSGDASAGAYGPVRGADACIHRTPAGPTAKHFRAASGGGPGTGVAGSPGAAAPRSRGADAIMAPWPRRGAHLAVCLPAPVGGRSPAARCVPRCPPRKRGLRLYLTVFDVCTAGAAAKEALAHRGSHGDGRRGEVASNPIQRRGGEPSADSFRGRGLKVSQALQSSDASSALAGPA